MPAPVPRHLQASSADAAIELPNIPFHEQSQYRHALLRLTPALICKVISAAPPMIGANDR